MKLYQTAWGYEALMSDGSSLVHDDRGWRHLLGSPLLPAGARPITLDVLPHDVRAGLVAESYGDDELVECPVCDGDGVSIHAVLWGPWEDSEPEVLCEECMGTGLVEIVVAEGFDR